MIERMTFPAVQLAELARRSPTQWTTTDTALTRHALLQMLTRPDLLQEYLAQLTAGSDSQLRPLAPILGLGIWDEFELELPQELLNRIIEGGPGTIEQLGPEPLAQLLRCPVGLQELEDLIGSTVPSAWLPLLMSQEPAAETSPVPPDRGAERSRSGRSYLPLLALAFSMFINFGLLGYWLLSPPGAIPSGQELAQLTQAKVQRGVNARGPAEGFTLGLQANRTSFATLVVFIPNQRLSIVPGPGEDLLKLERNIRRDWPVSPVLLEQQATVIVVLTQQPAHLLLEERLKLDARPAEAAAELPREIEELLKNYGYESPTVRLVPLPKPPIP